jgi:hypothetical protein
VGAYATAAVSLTGLSALAAIDGLMKLAAASVRAAPGADAGAILAGGAAAIAAGLTA